MDQLEHENEMLIELSMELHSLIFIIFLNSSKLGANSHQMIATREFPGRRRNFSRSREMFSSYVVKYFSRNFNSRKC